MTTITTQLADALRASLLYTQNVSEDPWHNDRDDACKALDAAREALAAYDAQQAQSKSCEYVLEGCERFIAAFHRGDFGAHGYKIVQDAAALLERIRASRICGHSACSQNYIDTGSRECVQTSDHTAEPWRVGDSGHVIPGITPYLESAANARRIVACVNACAGIPTASLEAGIVELGMDTLDNYRDISGGDQFPPRK